MHRDAAADPGRGGRCARCRTPCASGAAAALVRPPGPWPAVAIAEIGYGRRVLGDRRVPAPCNRAGAATVPLLEAFLRAVTAIASALPAAVQAPDVAGEAARAKRSIACAPISTCRSASRCSRPTAR
jgi:hypothetical protein